jgi:hypothetical protein
VSDFAAIVAAFENMRRDGVPEPIALLTVARRCIETAIAQTPGGTGTVRLQLMRITRDLIAMRDRLDDHLATKGT